MKHKKNDEAFTLIEIMIVISIIGILVGLLLTHLTSTKESARKATARTTIKNLETHCQTIKSTAGLYPKDEHGAFVAKPADSGSIEVTGCSTLVDALDGDGFNDRGQVLEEFNDKDLDIVTPYDGVNPRVAHLLDPWGNRYRYRENASKGYPPSDAGGVYTGFKIADDPAVVTTPGPNEAVFNRTSVDIWSPGPDTLDGDSGDPEAIRDNINSWDN